jgi:NADPH:quinone reductase-like Zn-dependent oxidoreductase
MTWTMRRGKRAIFAAAGLRQRTEDLLFLRERIETGEITAVVDRRYPFEEIAEAHRYVEGEHKKGAVVIALE